MDYEGLVADFVEKYLREKYNLSISSLDNWFGFQLGKFIANLDGSRFEFLDIVTSKTPQYVANEINTDSYNIKSIDFKPGDVVIDIGANIGMLSIFLAKRYPFLKIYAFEPANLNYNNFLKNIEINGVEPNTITVEKLAVTGDARTVTLGFNTTNSGGSGLVEYGFKGKGFISKDEDKDIKSITLDQIFEKYDIKNVKLLKIDCEGSEFEILKNCKKKNLKKIKNLRGEFHQDLNVRPENSNDELIELCEKYIPSVDIADLRR